ncbi:casein kinase substrate phospho protein PP28-domain-containing protein [Jimgerdemannia flammicorona]|uniref:Casein kinase substrate phospho protein PP28-domain-containing protein n=2 Tax=Jimgerdemannia flammicorona TaxID=994334 RepID=A0A433QL50_9FUNG|nr:casein kinase substrate phospho protein PP28-domain-containing protein [Jimgerdemannia flammicorona]RUS30487.1 casein kinase substrate phospho protein PP28-domain-containing protein [Jimgerdemannia flammicorona]
MVVGKKGRGSKQNKPQRGGGKRFSKRPQTLEGGEERPGMWEVGHPVLTLVFASHAFWRTLPQFWCNVQAREAKDDDDDDDSDEDEDSEETSDDDSDEEEDSDEDIVPAAKKSSEKKKKSTEPEVENPNRISKKDAKKASEINTDAPRELSRREREEKEKEEAKARYWKLHVAGETEQAQSDLARLAVIRKQREEAAKQREAEKKAKEDATKKKS